MLITCDTTAWTLLLSRFPLLGGFSGSADTAGPRHVDAQMQQQIRSGITAAADALPPVPSLLLYLPLDALEHVCSSLQLKDR